VDARHNREPGYVAPTEWHEPHFLLDAGAVAKFGQRLDVTSTKLFAATWRVLLETLPSNLPL